MKLQGHGNVKFPGPDPKFYRKAHEIDKILVRGWGGGGAEALPTSATVFL